MRCGAAGLIGFMKTTIAVCCIYGIKRVSRPRKKRPTRLTTATTRMIIHRDGESSPFSLWERGLGKRGVPVVRRY
jgi:hypothetical protein